MRALLILSFAVTTVLASSTAFAQEPGAERGRASQRPPQLQGQAAPQPGLDGGGALAKLVQRFSVQVPPAQPAASGLPKTVAAETSAPAAPPPAPSQRQIEVAPAAAPPQRVETAPADKPAVESAAVPAPKVAQTEAAPPAGAEAAKPPAALAVALPAEPPAATGPEGDKPAAAGPSPRKPKRKAVVRVDEEIYGDVADGYGDDFVSYAPGSSEGYDESCD